MKINTLLLIGSFVFIHSALPMKRGYERNLEWSSAKRHQLDLNEALLCDSDSCGCQVESLIEEGADVNARDQRGMTPLMRATIHNFVGVVKVLLSCGAQTDLCEPEREFTALMFAVEEGRKRVVRMLLEHGAHRDRRTGKLDNCGGRALRMAVAQGHLKIAELLLLYGADIQQASPIGWMPLNLAAFWGNREMAELLLDRGANINQRGFLGRTPLADATIAEHAHVVNLLLERGADNSIPDNFGDTPLQSSIRFGNVLSVLHRLLVWAPDQTIAHSRSIRKNAIKSLIMSQRYDAEHAAQMVPPLDTVVAYEHLDNLDRDPIVRPMLKKLFDRAGLVNAIKRNVNERLADFNV